MNDNLNNDSPNTEEPMTHALEGLEAPKDDVVIPEVTEAIPVQARPEPVKKKPVFKKALALVVALTLAVSGGFGAGYSFVKYNSQDPIAGERPMDNEVYRVIQTSQGPMSNMTNIDVANKVSPSVVAITSTVEVQDYFRSFESQGSGSGVIYDMTDETIFMITNHHVIEDAKTVTVEFFEGTKTQASLVGTDPETDLALIQVKTSDVAPETLKHLKKIEIKDSDDVLVGESVMAVGNALGYGRTVTVGVVSALNRSLQLQNTSLDLIQTDAAINPGNSGGALVNAEGQLIGINTVKISSTNVEGVGFAIPTNNLLPIIENIKDQGYVSRPYLGIYGKSVDEATADLYEIPLGVIVMDLVKGSGAEAAGLNKGDVILKIDGQKIMTMEALVEAINSHAVGDQVDVTVIRSGGEKEVLKITLQEKNKQ